MFFKYGDLENSLKINENSKLSWDSIFSLEFHVFCMTFVSILGAPGDHFGDILTSLGLLFQRPKQWRKKHVKNNENWSKKKPVLAREREARKHKRVYGTLSWLSVCVSLCLCGLMHLCVRPCAFSNVIHFYCDPVAYFRKGYTNLRSLRSLRIAGHCMHFHRFVVYLCRCSYIFNAFV